MIPPIAATVAGLEPEIAPKKPLATTEIQDRRPGSCLSNSAKNPISRSEIPPLAMMLPARMKNGTAISVKLSSCVNMRVGTEARYCGLLVMTIVNAAAIPRLMAIGTPRNRKKNSTENKIPAASMSYASFSAVRSRYMR